MPTFIVGLDRVGATFYNNVINYCNITGHPGSPELYKQIYDQCLSQILHKMDSNIDAFMLNLVELPCWDLIYYLPTPLQPQVAEIFKGEFRAFALWIWTEFNNKGLFNEEYVYIFENASTTFVIVNAYIDAGQI